MSRRKGKHWQFSVLKKRGWTRELVREYLPKPSGFISNGNYIKVWKRNDVLDAERMLHFDGLGNAEELGDRYNRKFCEALKASWEAARRDDGDEWLLAGHYNGGIIRHIVSSGRGRGLSLSQTRAWLSEFLALEQRCDSQSMAGIIKHFVRVGRWIEERMDGELFARVCERYPHVLLAIARRVIADFTAAQPEADVRSLLDAEGFPEQQLLSEGLGAVWSVWYVPQAIRTDLSLLIALNPKDEYPEARAMHRRFILHIGGTNTGKTYAGFQRLMRAGSGVYLAPLRLLALEAQETMLKAGVECGHAHRRHSGKAGYEAPLGRCGYRRVPDDSGRPSRICLDSGHIGRSRARGAFVCRARGEGAACAYYRKLR